MAPQPDDWHVHCGGCGTNFPAIEEIADDVCPYCGRHSVLSPRFRGIDHPLYGGSQYEEQRCDY